MQASSSKRKRASSGRSLLSTTSWRMSTGVWRGFRLSAIGGWLGMYLGRIWVVYRGHEVGDG